MKDAPVKGFYRFDDSAHSPILEEPDLAHDVMRLDVLHGANGLADIRRSRRVHGGGRGGGGGRRSQTPRRLVLHCPHLYRAGGRSLYAFARSPGWRR